jgi:hypothetical protein
VTTVYSPFFEGSKILAESPAGILVFLKLERSDDLVSVGDATAVIYNLSNDVLIMEINSIIYRKKEVGGFPRSLRIEHGTHEVLKLGSFEIDPWEKSIELRVISSRGTRSSDETIAVKRQTSSDIQSRSGPDGIRPRLTWKPDTP